MGNLVFSLATENLRSFHMAPFKICFDWPAKTVSPKLALQSVRKMAGKILPELRS